MADNRTYTSWRAKAGLLVFGLLVLVLVDLLAAAALALLPPSATPDDGFSDQVPPFIRERAPDGHEMWVVHPARRHSFNTQSFPVIRPDGSLLVFCLGGSSVYGYPNRAEYAFPHRLESALRRRHPERDIHIVNLGGMSYGSHRLRLLTRQLMAYHPDVVVVYTGHNEFVEWDAARLAAPDGGPLGPVLAHVRRLAVYRLSVRLVAPLRSPVVADSVFGIDVQRREMRAVHEREIDEAVARLAVNLQEIVRVVLDNGSTPVLCTVASNLRHWRPETSAMASDLEPATVLRLASHVARARLLAADGRGEAAVQELEAARALDPGYAGLSFDTARLLSILGRSQEAAELFAAARDHDPTPIRAPTTANNAVRGVAQSTGVALIDVERAMAAAATDGVPGTGLFLDYCHPNADGHDLVARELLPELEDTLGLRRETTPDPAPVISEEASVADGETGFSLWWKGNVALRQGRPEEAEDKLRRAAELKPTSARPLVSLSHTLKAQGRREEALEVARHAVELEPESVMALNSLGVLLGQTRRSDEALEILHRALVLDPRASMVHLNLGAEYLRRRQPDLALVHLHQAVRLHPNILGAHRNIGLAHLLRDDQTAAATAFLDELRRNPLDRRSAERLAEAAAGAGQPHIAREATELAALLQPPSTRPIED